MKKVVITAAVRSAIGSFGQSFKQTSVDFLGAKVTKEAMIRSGINGQIVDEVILGCAIQAGLGQNLARQCAIQAGIPVEIPALTVNQVCGSSLRAISLAAQLIKAGDASVVIAAGAENMSQAPLVMRNMRLGHLMGNIQTQDEILNNLTDKYYDCHMGVMAENLAKKFSISREEQDRFALWSHMKAKKALESNRFSDEICPIEIIQANGSAAIMQHDEHIYADTSLSRLEALKSVFDSAGTVTAGNSSGINDGAAALILMSEEQANAHGIPIIAEVVSYAQVGVEPLMMGYAPVPAIKQALSLAKLQLSDIDLIELNEAFAVQVLAVIKGLRTEGIGEVAADKLNVNGGAIALGSPIGASGARIVVTLLYEMMRRGSRLGLAALCMGGGIGSAIIVKRYSNTD
ncbi:acetyl-CoA acetyltransferase [Chania multitudinisentens RB-25]|uniref:Acetyl-CoA acetyltransferase n=1 Tax=Chania multitudinisentens RB-25 TaxID=1441930 RepID=W0L463_9GAMM|nr:acetyl-CoA C-acetyltransferase [Chania multitudinisentens]AHG18553.1 acetyl-CoA acetyltransferase [Chania multitudinisentens RB-25]